MPKEAARKIVKSVLTSALYHVAIAGINGILFHRLPIEDFSQPKSAKKDAAKFDYLEREQATWRNKLHTYEDGTVYLPGQNMHQCLIEATKFWGSKIPGEGNRTYTDPVNSAVVIEDFLLLNAEGEPIHKDDAIVQPFGAIVNGTPSKGKGGPKVYKIRPRIEPWTAVVNIEVFDARINIDVLSTILSYAGAVKGLGDWRPRYGRFVVETIEEVDCDEIEA